MNILKLTVLTAIVAGSLVWSSAPSIAATPVAGCVISPMADVLYAELLATPVVAATPEPLTYPPTGDPVDDETRSSILATMTLFEFCTQAGDLQRLATLTMPDFFLRVAFGSEPVAILQATPGSEPAGNAPEGASDQQVVTMLDARLQDDGSVVAVVDKGDGQLELVRFVAVQSGYLIADIQTIPETIATPSAEPDTASIGSIVQAVVADASTNEGVEFATIVVAQVEAVEWSDASLGCPEEGGMYAAVITPGYRIILGSPSGDLEYHTDLNGNFVRCKAN